MTESTVHEVWIDISIKKIIKLEGGGSANEAMEEALRLMPSHAIDGLERHGYRIKTIETDCTPAKVSV